MTTVNMFEAKTNLSKLVEAVESGSEKEIVIARNGKPVARLVPLEDAPKRKPRRLGIAEGKLGHFDYEAFQALDEVIWKDWLAKPLFPPPPRARKSRSKKSG